jgi:hypothetical protein
VLKFGVLVLQVVRAMQTHHISLYRDACGSIVCTDGDSSEAAQARAQAAAKRGMPNGGPTPTNSTAGTGVRASLTIVDVVMF